MSALTNGKTYTCTVLATNVGGQRHCIGRFGIRGSCDRAERTRGTDPDPRQRADLGRVRRPRQRWDRDHGLHRELHVE